VDLAEIVLIGLNENIFAVQLAGRSPGAKLGAARQYGGDTADPAAPDCRVPEGNAPLLIGK